MKVSYLRFALMIATSALLMFAMMYLNTWSVDHIWFSWTRAFMTMIMAATMAVVMLAFMLNMYRNRTTNIAIISSSVLLFILAIYLVRSQATVGDVDYMKAMIPHHSIAILTSTRARISDPRVRKLADGIIDTQLREISEMEALIADLESKR